MTTRATVRGQLPRNRRSSGDVPFLPATRPCLTAAGTTGRRSRNVCSPARTGAASPRGTEGYIAHVDDDGDLTFKAQGRTLYMTLSEDDSTYLRIFTDLTVPADKADELAVLREGNRLECKLKCVKCMLLDQDEERYFIRVAIECFSDTEILEEEITRYIDIVCAAHFELGQTLLM